MIIIAFCLIPTGAHLLELPNKIILPAAEYMTVQKIYSGWAFVGVAFILAPLTALWHAWLVREDRAACLLSLAAALGMTMVLAVFVLFTYPMNVVSQNWTVIPEPFEAARRQWEYSHAVNAVLTFVSFLAIVLSAAVHCGRRSA